MSRYAEVASAICRAQEIEHATAGRSPAARPQDTPWIPFPLFSGGFIDLAAEAVAWWHEHWDGPDETDPAPPSFLGIGAGYGSKELIARDVFGLDVHGIEISEEMAAAARSLGLDVATADAGDWAGYGKHDIIWLNRPFRHPAAEAFLEQRVWTEAAPGTVVICANLEYRPPDSWFLVLDDWEIRRGIWAKPPAAGLAGPVAGHK